MIINSHRFFSLACWWPSLNADGREAWNFVHGTGIDKYHHSLQVLPANFVKSIEKFSKSYPLLSGLVDRPNTERLMELVYHTIPLFNHVAFVCELVYESAHQPLKFFLSRNHTLSSHLYSVHLILSKDWMIRLWSLWRIHRDEAESADFRHHALVGLIRLLVGDEVDKVRWASCSVSKCLNEIREHINHLMIGTVEKRLDKWYQDAGMSFHSVPRWELQIPPKSHRFSLAQNEFFKRALTLLSTLSLQPLDDLRICYMASLFRGFGSSSKSTHEGIRIGDIVQLLLTADLIKENVSIFVRF